MTKIDTLLTAWREDRTQPTYDELVAVQADHRELLTMISEAAYTLEKSRIWGGMEWKYHSLPPVHYLLLRDKLRTTFEKHVKPSPNA